MAEHQNKIFIDAEEGDRKEIGPGRYKIAPQHIANLLYKDLQSRFNLDETILQVGQIDDGTWVSLIERKRTFTDEILSAIED